MTRAFITAMLLMAASCEARAVDLAVVAKGDPGEEVSARTIERIYLKRKTLWANGAKVVPLNLPASSELRAVFSRAVLKRGPRELTEYWNEQYFKGNQPPLVLESEDAVKRFVREVNGAVGYIRLEAVEPDLDVLYVIRSAP